MAKHPTVGQILIGNQWRAVPKHVVEQHIAQEYGVAAEAFAESYRPEGIRCAIRTVRQVVVEDKNG